MSPKTSAVSNSLFLAPFLRRVKPYKFLSSVLTYIFDGIEQNSLTSECCVIRSLFRHRHKNQYKSHWFRDKRTRSGKVLTQLPGFRTHSCSCCYLSDCIAQSCLCSLRTLQMALSESLLSKKSRLYGNLRKKRTTDSPECFLLLVFYWSVIL